YIDEKDTMLSVLPIHHTYECTCGFLCPVYKGLAVAYSEGLRHIPDNMREARPTILLAVPLLFERFHDRIWEQAGKHKGKKTKLRIGIKLSNFLRIFGIDVTRSLFKEIHDTFGGRLRLMISGAAAIDPKVSKFFRSIGVLFLQGYGLTECSPIAALNTDTKFRDRSAGLKLSCNEVEVRGKGADGIGEVCVKGGNVMMGYHEDPETTAKVMEDGWFRTGDMGYLDRNGFLYLTGRKKNVIVTKNGKNVYPEEIESLLAGGGLVKECVVYAKDSEDGEDTIIAAEIVVEPEEAEKAFGKGWKVGDAALADAVKAHIKEVNKRLPTYKRVKDFDLTDKEFEKTTTKKVKRHLVSVLKDSIKGFGK
ncbi:MAG: AMP-binding protein, partial [Oscillospiraceae bacterium]|nr:AMP-binding protein [Oscillospiraceae bacterium]